MPVFNTAMKEKRTLPIHEKKAKFSVQTWSNFAQFDFRQICTPFFKHGEVHKDHHT